MFGNNAEIVVPLGMEDDRDIRKRTDGMRHLMQNTNTAAGLELANSVSKTIIKD